MTTARAGNGVRDYREWMRELGFESLAKVWNDEAERWEFRAYHWQRDETFIVPTYEHGPDKRWPGWSPLDGVLQILEMRLDR